MKHRFFHKPKFHLPSHAHEKKASWMELFYDLIYVAAFIQLGNIFAKDISLATFMKCSLVFVPLWLIWSGFTYYANRVNIDDFFYRTLVFIQMFCVGAMAITIGDFLNGSPLIFVCAYSVAQLIIVVLYARTYIQESNGRDYSLYWGSVFFASSIAWLMSHYVKSYQIVFYFLGCLIIFGAVLYKKGRELSEKYPFDHEHLAERYGLLTIIVLGESFVKVLSDLSGYGVGVEQVLQASFALLLTCTVWWIYFDDVAHSHLKKHKFSMPIWLFSHIPLQLAIIFMGVGIKKAIHFGEVIQNIKYAYLLSFALGAIFITTAIIDLVTVRHNSEMKNNIRVNIRMFSGIICILVGLISDNFSGNVFLSFCLIICLFQIIFDIFTSPIDVDAKEIEELAQPLNEVTFQPKATLDMEPLKKGVPSDLKKDLYFFLMQASWTQVIVGFAFVYFLANLFFASLYLLDPMAISEGNLTNKFLNAFFFSVQTMTTIGYGAITPLSAYANVIVTLEAAFGLIATAVMTGIVYAKLSKPSAKILFSRNILFTTLDGQKVLTWRVGNVRGNNIIDANMALSALVDHTSKEGEHLRKIVNLELVRNHSPFFKFTWSASHVIDENSPLYGMDFKKDSKLLTLLATLTGHDETYSSKIYKRHNYNLEDIVKDRYFKDIIQQLPSGQMVIDYNSFHDLK